MNSYYVFLKHLLLTKIINEELYSSYSLIGVRNLRGKSNSDMNPNDLQYFHEGYFDYGIKVYYIDGNLPNEL